MAEIYVKAEQPVGAPAERVYTYIADHRQHHRNFLPPAFSDFHVEAGGVGAGTVIRFKGKAGGGRASSTWTSPSPSRGGSSPNPIETPPS